MEREDAEKDVLEGPLASVVTEDVFVVPQKSRKRVIIHKLVLDIIPCPLLIIMFR